MKRMIAGGSMGTEGRKKIRRSALAASLRGVCVIVAALVLITNLGRGSVTGAGETGMAASQDSGSSRQREKAPDGGMAQESGGASGNGQTGNGGEGADSGLSQEGGSPGGGEASGIGTCQENDGTCAGGTSQENDETSGGTSQENEGNCGGSSPESEASSERESSLEEEGSSERESTSESESSSESELSSERESSSESEGSSGSESQMESESSSGSESQSESEKPAQPETQKPEWPKGHYKVSITDVRVCLPEGGRVYDGTDRIEITFQTQIRMLPEETKDAGEDSAKGAVWNEKIPEYHVSGSAHLDSPDAGERKVLCSFSLQTDWPDHVILDEATTAPDLSVTVKKALLNVQISDGRKRYGEPADLKHIRMEDTPVVRVSGFVRDAEEKEVIPPGFELPLIAVDPSVLQQWSPIYDQETERRTGHVTVRKYHNALILKKDQEGRITGNPTENYEFCCDPEAPGYSGGTVIVERSPVQRGVTFELKGEAGAYRQNENGTVTVRSGTFLMAEPLSGQGYNTGAKYTNTREDGVFTFHLEKRGKDGTLAADSLEETVAFHSDESVPEAEMTVNGARNSDGLWFGASSVSISIQAPEDEGSGLESVRYRVLSGTADAQSVLAAKRGEAGLSAFSQWKQSGNHARVNLSGSRICQIEVETRDFVGNTALSRSPVVVIDTDAPEIRITGVEDGSANASAVRIQVQCQDSSLLPGSLKAEMKADFGGVIPARSPAVQTPDGESFSFSDFPRTKEADAVYHLNVTARDRAGNLAEKKLTFSVNRFGSSFSLADQTASMLKVFYHIRPFDVTFLETNLNQVGNARILLRSQDTLVQLRAGEGLIVNESRGENGVSRYSYTVPASRFTKDGVYEVMLLTTDQAGNSTDSSAQRLPVRFAIDTHAPECLVSGIRPEGRYKEEEVTAVVEVRDNLALDMAELYVDARRNRKMTGEQLRKEGGIMKLKLSEKEAWQTVQVHAADQAGNEYWTEEIPVYISSKDPESAENYHSERLSAQQIESARKQLTAIWNQLETSTVSLPFGEVKVGEVLKGKRLLPQAAVPEEGTLLQGRALFHENASSKPGESSHLLHITRDGRAAGPSSGEAGEETIRKDRSRAGILLPAGAVLFCSLAGGGIFLYQRGSGKRRRHRRHR